MVNSYIVIVAVTGLLVFTNALDETNSTDIENSSMYNETLDSVAIPEAIHSNQMANSQNMDHHAADSEQHMPPMSGSGGSMMGGGSMGSMNGSMSNSNGNMGPVPTMGSSAPSSSADAQGLSQSTEGTNSAISVMGFQAASLLLVFYIV